MNKIGIICCKTGFPEVLPSRKLKTLIDFPDGHNLDPIV